MVDAERSDVRAERPEESRRGLDPSLEVVVLSEDIWRERLMS